MLNIVKYASAILAKYRLEIEPGCTSDFWKTKFLNDRERNKKICNIIYKKQQ